jgi:hypothetical protein
MRPRTHSHTIGYRELKFEPGRSLLSGISQACRCVWCMCKIVYVPVYV